MLRARTEACKRLAMLLGAVSFMALKPVTGKAHIQLGHPSVPPYFGHYRGGRDREYALISAGDGLLWEFQFGDPDVVDKQAGRRRVERFHGTPHGGPGGGQQALFINFLGGGLANADRNCQLANLLIAAIARGRSKLLRVSHFRQSTRQVEAAQGQHDRSRHDWPSQSAPPGLIYAGDVTVAAGKQF